MIDYEGRVWKKDGEKARKTRAMDSSAIKVQVTETAHDGAGLIGELRHRRSLIESTWE